CQVVKLRPERGGMMLEEGVGTFRLKNPVEHLDALVAVKAEGDRLQHFIQVHDGKLLARLPGEAEPVSVTPSAPIAAEFDPAAGTARRIEWRDPGFAQNVAEYRLEVETDIEAQKAEHESKVNEKRGDALQKIIEKAPKKIKLPKFRFR
ncbi:MAG TPA: hypothetical protein PLY73_08370, partial [Candidatus Ozemobacteraceae bacterium]|nr:hypothetical protein [Candidatus Ozemobacteraceae bacterium]